jgi:uncharacterized membrane protein YqjE
MEPDRSISAVLSDIVGDVQQIIRAETRLAKAELREELGKARRGAMFIGAGGIVLVLSAGLLLLSLVYALALVWPAWAAALAVAGLAGAIGLTLTTTGRRHLGGVALPPQKTATTIKENLQWAKSRAK